MRTWSVSPIALLSTIVSGYEFFFFDHSVISSCMAQTFRIIRRAFPYFKLYVSIIRSYFQILNFMFRDLYVQYILRYLKIVNQLLMHIIKRRIFINTTNCHLTYIVFSGYFFLLDVCKNNKKPHVLLLFFICP